VIAVNGTGIHLFNGQVTLVLRNSRYAADGKLVPMTKGRIQLQSELAEIWYRKPEIRAIREFPAEVREGVDGPGGDDAGFTKLLDEAPTKDWAETGSSLLWYKARPFKNFVLRGEYTGGTGDPGVCVRFPDPAETTPAGSFKPTWLPVRPGEWNSYEVACVGKTSDLRLNGHLIGRVLDGPLEGFVGFQSSGKSVRHRNVRIKELP